MTCKTGLNRLPKIFNSLSKNIGNENDKHFAQIILYAVGNSTNSNESVFTLEDNTFSDITFANFDGYGIKKIHTKAFNKTAHQITNFYCLHCEIVQSSPESVIMIFKWS